MSKLEQIYKQFLEEINRPEKRKAELTREWHRLKALEESTKQAFAEAEAKGEPSDKLFDDYRKATRDKELTEARLKVEVTVDAKAIAEELKEEAYKEYQRLLHDLQDKTEELEKKQLPVLDALADIVQIREDIQRTKDLLMAEARRYTVIPPDFRVSHHRPFNEYLIDETMVQVHRSSRKASQG